MVGTRDLARIADHVERAGGAIKLIGDPDQHGAVETGGFFRLLCDSQGDDLVRLVENNRQQLDDRPRRHRPLPGRARRQRPRRLRRRRKGPPLRHRRGELRRARRRLVADRPRSGHATR